MNHLIPPAISQDAGDLAGALAGNGIGLVARVRDQPAGNLAALVVRPGVASERREPVGREGEVAGESGAARALCAPSSTTIRPLGLRLPAIHRLRAACGVAVDRNQVARPPSRSVRIGRTTWPLVITMRQPALVAILAASSLVYMPPDP